MDKFKYIEQLLDNIKLYNEAYRAGKPMISDAEYDRKVAELKALDPDNEWFQSPEPGFVAKGRKAKLPIPMKSLNKVKCLKDVKQWVESCGLRKGDEIVIMPKYDGVSWLHDETTNRTYSRGGAENEGQDCTSHFIKGGFKNAKTLNAAFTFGELVFSRQNWEKNMAGKVSDSTGEIYRSPRNTVAGFINRDEAPEEIKHASFVRYGIDENSLKPWTKFSDLLADMCEEFGQYIDDGVIALERKGAHPFCVRTVAWLSEESLHEMYSIMRKYFYIDGLVLYVNNLLLWGTLGRQQTTGNPLYAVAYKHPDFTESFETTVKKVDWNISKAGALKPVVNIEAVDTGDCTMENPTGYNARYIFENGIGTGAKIIVTRSGGVIPKILDVIEEASQEAMMEQRESLLYCHHCHKPTKWNDTKVELVCDNPDCPGVRFAKVVHFYTTLEAEQMGEETISKLFKAGYDTLRRILDITFDELLLIEGFGESIANIILDTNKRIREGVEITKLMHASDCFLGIGQVKAKNILLELSDSDRYAIENGHVLTEPGFDTTPQFLALSKTLQSFLKGICPFYDFVAINKLKILPLEAPVKPIGDKYAGMKVCFTGVRDKELEAEIIAQGGEIVSGVSKKTTHLIVADMSSTSSKMTKAQALNIPVFTIETFKAL